MQPTLHDSHVILRAPTQVVCGADGRISDSVEGVYHGDVRVVSHLSLACDGTVDCVRTAVGTEASLGQVFTLRGIGEPGPDPEVILTRTCRVRESGVEDAYRLHNYGTAERTVRVGFDVRSDLAGMDDVKAGRAVALKPPTTVEENGGTILRWETDALRITVRLPGRPGTPLAYRIPPGGSTAVAVIIEVTAVRRRQFAAVTAPADVIPQVTVAGGDDLLPRVFRRSLADLRALLLAETDRPGNVFLSAGAPWYLTLFGRDSIWAARLALPVSETLGLGTLRVLARRQATGPDRASQAEPGKILHEVREAPLYLDRGVVLPPLYYGSIDSTLLWISLLHDLWRSGAPDADLEPLLPHLAAALDWMESAVGDDGFIRYVDASGHGLSNQGWKDSADGIRHKDGTLGVAPIALCEVQGYAFAAATEAAALQRYFGVGSPDKWLQWAADLADRFRAAFWVDSALGPHPAVALDATARPVSALTSNIGHLLGTGICDRTEVAQIARVVADPAMDSGFGLRTMARDTTGYNPLGYHTGSVWPHDTMIVARGLSREGYHREAARLARGVLAAAAAFDGRLPELYGGFGADEGLGPVAYPPSCRPQAWSSASVVEALRIFIGLEVDIPAGLIRVSPRPDGLVKGLRVRGLRVGGHTLAIGIDAAGRVNASADTGFPVATDGTAGPGAAAPAAAAPALVAPRRPDDREEVTR